MHIVSPNIVIFDICSRIIYETVQVRVVSRSDLKMVVCCSHILICSYRILSRLLNNTLTLISPIKIITMSFHPLGLLNDEINESRGNGQVQIFQTNGEEIE